MKQFSLEEFKKDPSKKVVTRDRREVRIVCTDYKSDYPIIGLVTIEENKELAYNFQKNGRYYFSENKSSLDLFFAPIKREGWVNIFRDRGGAFSSQFIFETEKKAKEVIGKNHKSYITTIKIEWEE